MNANESFFESLNYAKAPHIRTTLPGPKASELLARQRKVDSQVLVYPNFMPLAPESGLGATVKDVDENYFIDFSAGVGVLNTGHSNSEIVKAIKDQCEKLIHGLDFPGLQRVVLSEKLFSIAPGGLRENCKVFLVGPTGTDAVEAALKLAKHYTKKTGVISFEGGWHGVSGAGLAATGKKGTKESVLPTMPEVYHVPYAYCYRCAFGKIYPSCDLQCAKYVEHVVRDPNTGVCRPGAIILEPIQGEGGFVVPPNEFMQEMRRICDKYELLLIIDEIQTGFGRTGEMFCCEHSGVTPDIMTVAKSLGGGLPIAGLIFKKELDVWPSGSHFGTFRGNLLSCVAGLAGINFIQNNDLATRTQRLGEKVLKRLKVISEKSPYIGDVRGRGLLVGCEFVKDKTTKEPAPDILAQVQKKCFEKGLMLWKGGAWNNFSRIMPALVISEKLLEKGMDIFEEVTFSM